MHAVIFRSASGQEDDGNNAQGGVLTQTTAEIKTYYVEKGRPIVLNSMIDFTLAELVRRGVYKIKAFTHAEHSAGRIWVLKGFEISEIGYSLKLKPVPGAKYA